MKKTSKTKKYGIYFSDVEYNSTEMIIDFNRKICVEAWLSKPRKSPEDYIVVIRPENKEQRFVYLNGNKFLSLVDSPNFDLIIEKERNR